MHHRLRQPLCCPLQSPTACRFAKTSVSTSLLLLLLLPRFGYDTSGATPCPEGYYSSAGSLLPCTKCPPGRTTLADPAKQISITNCIVADGNGLFDGDWDIPTTLTPQQYANLTALPCPIGYYGADTTTGSTVNATCTKCPNSKFTRQEGSKLADCNGEEHVWSPGLGLLSASSLLSSVHGHVGSMSITGVCWSVLSCRVGMLALWLYGRVAEAIVS